jgi:hypothetical protein
MQKEIDKYENHCDNLICGIFETVVLPTLRKRALKIGIEKIEECNNYWFFTIKGKDYIEREFYELGSKHYAFYKNNIVPIQKSRYSYPKNFKFSMYP